MLQKISWFKMSIALLPIIVSLLLSASLAVVGCGHTGGPRVVGC
jgi:hypothetical protein